MRINKELKLLSKPFYFQFVLFYILFFQGGKAKQDAASAAKENKVENEIMATVESFR